MKKRILCAMIAVARLGLQGLYALMKLLPVKNRACFFSRQASKPSLDFTLLQRQLGYIAPQMEIVTICHRFQDRRDGLVRFAADQLRSMYLLATSRVCVLDGYWPAVSLLRHRRELRVIQIWHSVGKIKRSGYQTLGMASGRDATLARALRMHRGYDYIISGGAAWEPYYCQAFDTTPDKLRHYGLPRLDWLLEQEDRRQALERTYPELKGRTVVLYAPTYRTYPIAPHEELTALFDADKYALICRFHPNQRFAQPLPEELRRYDGEDIFSLLSGCDYLITDYSSLALEGAALQKKTMYYLFDRERYLRQNGLNIDPAEEMPDCSFERAEDLYAAIDSGRYPLEQLHRYQEKYLPEDLGHSTRNIAMLIAGVEQTQDDKVKELV